MSAAIQYLLLLTYLGLGPACTGVYWHTKVTKGIVDSIFEANTAYWSL